MKAIFLIIGTFAANIFFAQDTLHFFSKPAQVVKVNEIGIDEIKYHRLDNPDGPMYIANKSDIHFIKYSNGHVDTFKVTQPKTQEPSSFTIISSASPANEKIIVRGSKLIYMNHQVGESRLLRIINAHPDTEKKSYLLKEYRAMKSFKKKQYLFGFVGLGVGLALPYIGFAATILTEEISPVLIGTAAGLTVGITGGVLSGINKHKRTKKKIEIANLYNN